MLTVDKMHTGKTKKKKNSELMQSIDRLVPHSITRLKRAERKVSPALIGVSETRHLHRRKGKNQIKKNE